MLLPTVFPEPETLIWAQPTCIYTATAVNKVARRGIKTRLTYVELSATLGVSRVQSKKLNTHEVVARCNASGHFEVLPPAILNHAINTPLTVVVGQTVVMNLEPSLAVCSSGCGIVDLGQPDGDRALVTGSDGVVGVVGDLRATNNMAPPCTNTSTSGNFDDVVIFVLEILVASEIRIVDVLNRLNHHGVQYQLSVDKFSS